MVLVAQWAACSGSVPTQSGSGGAAGSTAGKAGSGGAAVAGAGGGQVTGAGGGAVTGAGGSSNASGGATGGGGNGSGAGSSTMTRDRGGPDLAPPTGPGPGSLGGGPVTTSTTHLDIGVHDPSMIWDGSNYYYLFATGGTLNIRKPRSSLTTASSTCSCASTPAARA